MELNQLGPYRLERKLGRGGMGTVFAAVDDETGERVAVKVMPPALAGETGFRERFEVEIESLKKLSHPGIVRLLAYGEERGRLFYSMEVVRGTNLEKEIQSGRRYTWHEILNLAIELCAALRHAHDRGVVHRDIKPANLLIGLDGQIKISDFGIARLFGVTHLTAAGGVLGTAEYMSPEQADGRPVTPQCDLYSLGGVMYAMAAGRPPFQAKSLPQILHMQRFAEPDPLRRYCPEMPRPFDEIVARLLTKDPKDRFANAAVLGRHLEALLAGLNKLEREQGFVLAKEPAPSDVTAGDPLAATRIAAQPQDASGDVEAVRSWSNARPLSLQVETGQDPAMGTLRPPKTRFTKVPSTRQVAEAKEPLDISRWVGTGMLLVALLAVVGGGWYLTRPRTADALYADISTTVDESSYTSAMADVEEFLARFPDDPRARKARVFREEGDLERQERRYRVLLRRPGEWGELKPVERAFLHALAVEQSSPDQSVEKLQALLAVYDSGDASDAAVSKCLTLARRKLQALEQRLSSWVPNQRADLERRLDEADQLSVSEPERARRIREGLAELYGSTPWARDVVERAKRDLASPE